MPSILQMVAVIFLCLIFLSFSLSSPTNALLVYVSFIFTCPTCYVFFLLNLFLSQSASLLSPCSWKCKSSPGVLLYFLGNAVVDWNGGLCHFYLQPHWFHNSKCARTCMRTLDCAYWCVRTRTDVEWLQVFELQWGVSGSIALVFLWVSSSRTVCNVC